MSLGDTIKAFFRDPFVQQFGLFSILLIIGYGLSQTMDGGSDILNAMGTAMTLIMLITFTVIPISYIMNYLIYHSRWMRFGSGFVGWAFGGLVWVYIFIRAIGSLFGSANKIPYFGAFPLLEVAAQAPPNEGSWFATMLYTIFIQPVTTLFEVHIGGDVDRMQALLDPYIAPADTKPVNEGMIEAAKEIAGFAKVDADRSQDAPPEKRSQAIPRLATLRQEMRLNLARGVTLDTLKERRMDILNWLG